MILNNTGDNRPNCEYLRNTIAQEHIKVAQCFITNCAQREDTGQMLDTILDYMASKIQDLDTRYAQLCQQRLLKWGESVEQELFKAKNALKNYGSTTNLFTEKFNQLWKTLSNELEELVHQVRQEKKEPDERFQQQVETVISNNKKESGVPSLEEIEEIKQERNQVGAYSIAYAEYLHKIRTRISKNFLHLDGDMQESLNQMKKKIAHILAEKVGFQGLSNAEGLQLLANINNQIPEDFEDLKLGFTDLSNFNVTYAAIIQRNVREFFDELHSDRNPLTLEQTPTESQLRSLIQKVEPEYNEQQLQQKTIEQLTEDLRNWWHSHENNVAASDNLKEKNLDLQEFLLFHQVVEPSMSQAERLQIALEKLHTDAIKDCQEKLKELYVESSQICYVMVAEFVDRILWSERARDNWRNFLRDDEIAAKIWEEFRDIHERKQEREQWLALVKNAAEKNKVFHWTFS